MSIRWGFLGASWIATTAVAPAVHSAGNATLYAVASRDSKRAAALNPLKIHVRYEDLLSDPDVDAVYISLTNDLHCEWTIKALNAGKHVLCEKPLALDLAQVQLMAAAALASNRLLVEAVWSRWHPRFARIVELAIELGDLLSLDVAFTFPGSLDGNYRLNPKMGGGSLFDVGPYLAHALVAILNQPINLKVISMNRNVGMSQVDLTTDFEALINEKIKFTGLTSFEKPEFQKLILTGTKVDLECIGNEAFSSWKSPSSLRISEHIENFVPVDPYQIMIENFSAQVNNEDGWLPPIKDSIQVMGILDQLRLAP